MGESADYDVAIVGFGPVGAALANLLGIEGRTVCVIEREAAMYPLPRAGHFDDEVMRVWQTVGLADEIARTVRVNPGMRFVTSTGAPLVEWPRPQGIGPQGWHASYRFHQPYVDRLLRAGVERFPSHAVLLNTEVVAVDETAACVALTCRERGGDSQTVKAKYVVGCDGARSIIRQCIGSGEEDLGAGSKWVVVDVRLKEPRDDLGDMTIQYCDPERPTCSIRMVEDRRRWELMLMPGETPETICEPEQIWKLLSRWLAPDEATIERAAVYTFETALAKVWRKGRLMLAGDAAHRMPPTLGQGMCTGIRDVSNLAWKLAAVTRGSAPEALLDSYEAERKPHARQYLELAMRLTDIMQATDPGAVDERNAKLAQGPEHLVSIQPVLGKSDLNTFDLPAGTLSDQIRLSTGERMDDAVGTSFAVLGDANTLRAVSTHTREAWRDGAVALLADEGQEYLVKLGAAAVVIRPDRYLLGIAQDAADLDALTELLPGYQATTVGA